VTVVAAVDPGRRKCGLAVVCSEKGILFRQIALREDLVEAARRMLQEYSPVEILVGGSTGSREVVAELQAALERRVRVVDESHTTERARMRYFQDHPPRGLWRLIPLGLRVPPVPWDDYAAVVMVEDYLSAVCRVDSSETRGDPQDSNQEGPCSGPARKTSGRSKG
jgi:RNase H-fold protein (predicted Holliday junction resolvase)